MAIVAKDEDLSASPALHVGFIRPSHGVRSLGA
jgi:hypothetical protein